MTDADPADLETARQAIRDGANRLHNRATFHRADDRKPTEAAAIARARNHKRSKP